MCFLPFICTKITSFTCSVHPETINFVFNIGWCLMLPNTSCRIEESKRNSRQSSSYKYPRIELFGLNGIKQSTLLMWAIIAKRLNFAAIRWYNWSWQWVPGKLWLIPGMCKECGWKWSFRIVGRLTGLSRSSVFVFGFSCSLVVPRLVSSIKSNSFELFSNLFILDYPMFA